MNKYYSNYSCGSDSIQNMLMPDETVVWQGTPNKNAYIINKSMELMPFALVWLLIDGCLIINIIASSGIDTGAIFFVGFFLIHLAPVWIWILQTLTAGKRWRNTAYAVTDKRILVRNGLVGYQFQSVYYTDIENVSLHVGIIDKMLGVGDIIIHVGGCNYNNGKQMLPPAIVDINEPEKVFSIVQRTIMDIQADIHYPNALRPDNNPGYQTTYNRQ